MRQKYQKIRKYAAVVLILLAAFFGGNLAGEIRGRVGADGQQSEESGSVETDAAASQKTGEVDPGDAQSGPQAVADVSEMRSVESDSQAAVDAGERMSGQSDPVTETGKTENGSVQSGSEAVVDSGKAESESVTASASEDVGYEAVRCLVQESPVIADYVLVSEATEGGWGLSFQEEGRPPVANATFEELAQYDAYYAENTEEKVLYLTFDCGYENGNTPKILEALKKHEAPATFFCVGNFIQDNPELVKQIVAEGHTVGNHTLHHPDMTKISDLESFRQEMEGVEELYREVTGQEMTKYYRAPQGKYSESNLKMAQELGYKTFFWSLAYVDWYQDQQPTKEEAFEKLLGRVHPGAIVLLHNTSSTNGEILDELLAKWEEMGYTFKDLSELAE